jgi:hypothetical protein
MFFARRLWIVAACTAAVLLGASAAQAQNTKLLPADTEMSVTINIQQILKSDVLKGDQGKLIIALAKQKINDGLEEKGVDKWFKKANFDLFNDLTSITFAAPGGRNPEEAFILLEGKFDAEKIEAAAVEASKDAGGGLKVTKIAGVKAFELNPKEEKTLYIGILNKKTMIACATKDDFAEAVARLNGTKSGAFKDKAFDSLVKAVNNKQSISIVATANIMSKFAEKAPEGAPQVQQAAEFLKQMTAFSAAITIQKDIDFELGVNAKEEKTAAQYAFLGNAGMKAVMAKVEEAAKQDAKLQPAVDVLKTIKISNKGANLTVRGQVPFETLEMVLKSLPIPNN